MEGARRGDAQAKQNELGMSDAAKPASALDLHSSVRVCRYTRLEMHV